MHVHCLMHQNLITLSQMCELSLLKMIVFVLTLDKAKTYLWRFIGDGSFT